jgi:ribosomal protein S15P/S13E
MCREQSLQTLRQETGVQQTRYNDSRAQLQSLETQIANMRKTMNPSDDTSVQILAEMIRQRDTLTNQIRTTVYPQAQGAVTKLNAAVAEYNQRCTQRPMLKTDVDNASKSLSCPSAQ